MAQRGSAVGDSAASTVGVLAQGLARFGYTALVGRLLGPDVLSQVNVAFSAAILLSLLWPTGAGNAAAAFVRPGGDRAVTAHLQRSVLLASGPLLLAGAAIAFAFGGTVEDAVLLAALAVGWSFYIFGRGLMMGLGMAVRVAVWDVVTAVLALALLGCVVLIGAPDLALLPAVIGYVCFGVVAVTSARTGLGEAVPRATARHLRGFVVWNSLSLIATNGLMQISMVVAFVFDTPSRAGQFAAALALATPLSMLSQAVTQAMLPRFVGWQREEGDSGPSLRRATLVVTALTVLGAVLVIVNLPWALPWIFGEAFVGAVPVAQGLMVAVVGFSVAVFLNAYLSATGRARLATMVCAAASVVGLIVAVSFAVAVDGTVGAVTGAGVGMVGAAAGSAWAALRDRRTALRLD